MADTKKTLDELDRKYGISSSTNSTSTTKTNKEKQNSSSASTLDELDKKYGISGTATTSTKTDKNKQSNSTNSKLDELDKKYGIGVEKTENQSNSTNSKLDELDRKYGIGGTTTTTTPTKPTKTTGVTTYESAVKYLQDKGVPNASGIMTEHEWSARNRGAGTYQDYLYNTINELESSAQPRSANFLDVTWNSILRGYDNSNYGKESYKAMYGKENSKEEYEEKLRGERYNFTPDNKFEEFVSGAFELLGQQVNQWTDPYSLTAGLGAAGAVALAGQAGPQVVAPEEVITVPAAFAIGMTAGSAKTNMEIEAGLAYNEMIENGISHDVARNIATGVGAANALLEVVQLDDLIKSTKILSKTIPSNGVTKKLLSYLADRGIHVATETGEEVLQEATTLVGLDAARAIEGKDAVYTWGDVGDRLVDTAVSSAGSFAIMGGMGDVANVAMNGTNKAVSTAKENAGLEQRKDAYVESIIRDKKSFDALIESGKSSGEGTASHKIATKVEQAREQGKVSIGQVRNLVESIVKEQKAKSTTLEETAKAVVKERTRKDTPTGTPILERVEAMSLNGETISVEDARKASAYGENGAMVLANAVNNSNGKSFSEIKSKMHIAYLKGMSNQDITIKTNLEQEAYYAGKKDRAMQDLAFKENAKNATIYKGSFTENKYTENFTDAERIMISTFAKSLGMSISTVDKIIANVANGVVYEANAEHSDGKMRISANRNANKVIYQLVMHEGGHRMRQLAPTQFGVLMDALYKRAEGKGLDLGVTHGLRFDEVKAQHDNAGITMDTSGYLEEIAVRELEKIFSSAEEFNKWYEEISGNVQTKSAWEKFMDFVTELIEKVKRTIAQSKMTKQERAETKKSLAELERIKELYANAFKSAENAVEQKKHSTNSNKNLEIKTNKEYNGNTNHSLKEGDTKAKIVYSPTGIKLSASEHAKFHQSTSTEYYYSYKTHEGLQYQSCVTDDSHILYIYEDGGFGNYNVVAKISFANEDIINTITEEINNGTTYRITDLVNRVLQTFEVRRSGYSVYNTSTKRRISSRSNDTLSKGTSKANTRGTDGSSGRISGNQRGTRLDGRTDGNVKGNFSLKETAPTFYSQMGKTIAGMKQDKIGANSVVSYLTGRGVKAEEIKWSGIETFLEGKKSVTKAELQEFVAGSMLQIEEQQRGETIQYTKEQQLDMERISTDQRRSWDGVYALWDKVLPNTDLFDFMATDNTHTMLSKMANAVKKSEKADTKEADRLLGYLDELDTLEFEMSRIVAEAEGSGQTTKWDEYKLDGGENYRELIFKLPNSEYTNSAMRTHWGEYARGILAHARIQDFNVDGKKMLFIEEIQSDWHNEGKSKGYQRKLSPAEEKTVMDLTEKRTHLFDELKDVLEEIRVTAERAEKQNLNAHQQVEATSALWDKAHKLREEERALLAEAEKIEGKGNVPDAPFSSNYHEYVLKRLIRTAAEQGYDSIGWTPADIQSKRWSEQYAEGYRIEYDQDIPKFLNKYGKKWGAKVGYSYVNPAYNIEKRTAELERDIADYQRQINEILDIVGERGVDTIADEQMDFMTEGIEDLRKGIESLKGTKVWSMPITKSMKESVLYEGQPQFSLKEPVEQTKNLVAVHNMHVSELERTLDLGGLPMPSIAIIKAQNGHSEYGDVSLVFDKSVIDPKASSLNKVYGGDAWTPTYPTIEYKPNQKIADRISDKYYELSRKHGYDETRPLYNYVNDLERQLNTNKGEAGMINKLYENTGLMNLYLLDSGKGKVATVTKETRTELTDAEVEMNEFFINELGADVVAEVEFDGNGTPIEYRKNYMSKYGDAIRETYKKLLSEVYQFSDEEVQNALDSTKQFQYIKFVRDAYKYSKEGRVTIKTEDDYSATQKAIKEASGEGYRKWVDSLFKGVEEKSGIRNNADYFTRSGNPRSWEALHWENNLENVVKVMKAQNDVASGTFFAGHGVWGVAAKDYRSIEEMKADTDRLKQLPKEEYDKIKESFGERMSEIAHSIMDKSERNPFIAAENAMECIVDAVRSSKTKSGILNQLKQYKHLTVTETTVNDIVSLVNDISNMPTEYFEAKPKRAVELNEIATAIIPNTTSEATKARLDDMGIKYLEYEAGNEDARLNALNSLEDTKFSLKEDNDISNKDRKELLDTIQHLKSEFEITKFAKADPKKLAKMTRDVLKEYNSKADPKEIYKAIDALYQYMANGEDGHPAAWNDVYNRAYKVAQEIVKNALVVDDYSYQEYKSLRDYLRTTPMKFNEEYDSVPSSYENFNEFRRMNMGRLKFTKDGMSIDAVYQELASLYPEFFNEEEQVTTEAQLETIVGVLDSLRATEVNPFDRHIEQASMSLANDLTSRFFDIPQAKPTFADKAERRVVEERIKGGKKVEAVRQQRNAKIKQLVESQREKTKKQLDKVRQNREEKVAKEREKHKNTLAKMSEKQKAKVLRGKIIRHTGELNKTLLKATDKKHIPIELENAVVALLYNINMESNYSYDPKSGSYKKNDAGLPTNKTKAFLALKEVYKEIAKNNDYGLTLASELIDTTESGISNIFDEVAKLSDKKIADMTSEELTKIYDAICMVERSIATANKMFAMQKWENLTATAKAFEKSVATRRERRTLMEKGFTLDIETPLTFFSHFGEAGQELYQAFRNAQDNEQRMTDELAERIQSIVSLEEVQKAEKEYYEFTTLAGKQLTLTKAHIMDIYLLSKRKQGLKHLLYDPDSQHFGNGIHQPEVKSKNIRRDPESTRLTKTDLGRIISTLDKQDKAIADKMQKATLLLAKWGNKACMDVFGYEKFKDPNYWTIKSASESINQTVDKNKGNARSIKNMGSAKAVDDKATNALDIGGVFNVFNQHASDMICYSAWLGVMEDATKLYNYTFRDENGFKTSRTFVSMLEKYAGGGGEKYYLNLLKDIQNGISVPPDTATEAWYTKLYGNAAKAAVAFRLTVVAQQPMSIVRAANVLNPLSIIQATTKGGLNLPVWAIFKVKNIATKQSGQLLSEWYGGWERALKYAPIASRKAIGGYEINSKSSGLRGVLYKPETVIGKSVDAVKESPLWAAGKADEVTWGILWNACEIETSRKNESLEKGSEAYYEAVAKLFTDVINETQVVDGVLQRSQLMRSSSGWVKPATSFTGEPTQALNSLIRAYEDVRYETDPKKRGQAIKKLGRATTVLAVSAVLTAFARSLAVGVTGEDDEDYWKKVWKSFSGIQGDEETWFDYVKNIGLKSDVVNNMNPLSWLPIARDILSSLQGYDVERLDVASVGKFVDAGTKFVKSLDEEGKYTVTYATRDLLLKGAELMGWSPNNLVRDIEGAIRTSKVEANDVKGLYEMEKWRTKPVSNTSKYVDILYKAYETDSKDYEGIYNDMIKNKVDAEKIESGMETRMKKAEGVKKATDLTKRYLSPKDEKKYDSSLKMIQSSDVWKSANAEQRKNAKADLYEFLTSTAKDFAEMRAEAKAYGVDETDYTLWKLAIEMADQPKGEKGSGSYDLKEKAEAINSLDLGDKEIAYFFGRGLQENGKKELEEVLAEGIDIQEYVKFKAAVSRMEADKNAQGNSIPNSKKRKVVQYLNNANLTDEEWDYFYYEVMNYKK